MGKGKRKLRKEIRRRQRRKPRGRVPYEPLFVNPRLALKTIDGFPGCGPSAMDHHGNVWIYWRLGDDYGPNPPEPPYNCEGCGAEVSSGWARMLHMKGLAYTFRVFCDHCTTVSRYRPRFG